ncbi:MAG: hypothetical protein AB8H80_00650 [Planctomycetota bacterium]
MISSTLRLATLVTTSLVFALAPSRGVAQDAGSVGAGQPSNASFEEGLGSNGAPAGWRFVSGAGAKVSVEAEGAVDGERCAHIDARDPVGDAQRFTNLMHGVDAEPWRGKRVRYRAAVHTADLGDDSRVQLWMRVDRPDDANGNRQIGAFDNMGDRPIQSVEWQTFDVVLDVAADASRIVFGAFIIGTGSAWVDGVTLEEVSAVSVPTTGAAVPEPELAADEPEENGGRPGGAGSGRVGSGDAAVGQGSTQAAPAGSPAAETPAARSSSAASPSTASPSTGSPASGSPSGAAQEPVPVVPDDFQNGGFEEVDGDGGFVGWRHSSRFGATLQIVDEGAFEADRYAQVDASTSVSERPGGMLANLSQSLDAARWRGQRVRFAAAVKTADVARGAPVRLWMRVDRPKDANGNRQRGAFDNMGDRPIRSDDWQEHEIVLDVAEDATRITVGMLVMAPCVASLDGASLAAVDANTATTLSLIDRAKLDAVNAPQQAFWTPWLVLPALAMLLFVLGMRAVRVRGPVPDLDEGLDVEAARVPLRVGVVGSFAFRFTAIYWLLYCAPMLLTSVLSFFAHERLGAFGQGCGAAAGVIARTVAAWKADLAHWIGSTFVGIEGPLVPSAGNGSGDTTESYLVVLGFFGVALAVSLVLTPLMLRHRARPQAAGLDLMRSYLRYVLAFILLGYGLAKINIVGNQFGSMSEGRLDRTWGESSPMGVLWSFMASSHAYTVFAGLGEMVATLLLVWRRTATLGALVAVGVMVNVAMLNYCYDVPVKLYSTHLMVMGMLVLIPDAGRLLALFVTNRSIERFETVSIWNMRSMWWLGLLLKVLVLVSCFGVSLYYYGERLHRDWTRAPERAAAQEVPDRLLIKRGFRWINEVPFGR